MKTNSTHMEDSILIEAPIDTVFNYITDFRNTSQWHKNMKKVGWVSTPPHGEGSTYDWIETFAGMKMDIGGTITEWNPPYSFAWKPTTSPYPLSGGWRLVKEGDGTLVTRYSDNQLSGIYKWFQYLMLPMARKQIKEEMRVLKMKIEEINKPKNMQL